MSLLKEIRDSQSSQCTRNDLRKYSQTIKKQFNEIDVKVSTNSSAINSLEVRLSSIESSLLRNNYETELNKQNALSNNLNIMGIPSANDEDLTMIALKIFSQIGCDLTRSVWLLSHKKSQFVHRYVHCKDQQFCCQTADFEGQN